ncbi:MAG: cation:proton antiporter [Ilumatobacter sp.]|uniref:cation:proton antiporter n=1 Tax=Ilumatobacter sp. TaxID=1967498 RepID=UPI002624D0D7|nr:cation:proton antiporter [Ilumatobacter sp.]MDJ0767606.1 cation:proton antiporter [Ilumatobacter sp.]
MIAAGSSEAALAFIEIGAVALALAVLARFAGRLGMTAVPLYLLGGLAVGEGGIVTLDVSEDFISLAAEIGVLLLLLALGLEYDQDELRDGLRTGLPTGAVDMLANGLPGVGLGLLLGWSPLAAVLLGGVTWVSSSGIVSKVLFDLDRLGYRETPSVLNVLVIEDLAMAVYLPVVAALVVGGSALETTTSVVLAVGAVMVILLLALRFGGLLTRLLGGGTDESLLLAVFGLTLLVAGLAQSIEVSGAIGAFLVGLALSGHVGERAMELITPLRDLFAATFFVVFSFRIDPADLVGAIGPAVALAAVTVISKLATGWYAGRRAGVGARGRVRAGTALVARGEFSIVIAALGSELVDGPDLEALAACYVLIVAVVGPLITRSADRIPIPARFVPAPA